MIVAAGKALAVLGLTGLALVFAGGKKKSSSPTTPGTPGVPNLPANPGGTLPGNFPVPGTPAAPGGFPAVPAAPGGAPGVPGFPGGIPGFPGGIPGFPGGIPGMPGMPGTPAPPPPPPGPGGTSPAAPPGSLPTAPVPEGNGWVVQSSNGVMQLRPDLQPQALQALQFASASPASSPMPPGAPNATIVAVAMGGFAFGAAPARAWAEGEAAKGRNVLAQTTGEMNSPPQTMASVIPGQEIAACQRGSGWILFLTAPANPSGPSTGPTNPGDFNLPSPGSTPGGTVPANWLPGGLPQGLPQSMPPGFPGVPPGGVPGFPGMPATPGTPAPAPTGGTYKHIIRNGDMPSSMAGWYTNGGFNRWQELKQTNPDLQVQYENGQPYSFTNATWRVGKELTLPPGWDGSKGAGPTNYGVGGGGGSV